VFGIVMATSLANRYDRAAGLALVDYAGCFFGSLHGDLAEWTGLRRRF
jgi:hypothetical protein